MGIGELAERTAGQRWKQRIERAFGPAGIFFKGFLKHPAMVGAVLPSSRFTIESILKPVDWANTKVFVEYGPGVGTFARPVLDKLPRDGVMIAIDLNPDFVAYLKKTIPDGRFHAVHGSAEDVEAIVKSFGFDHADYVLSGLPFSTLPEGVGDGIAAATRRVLRTGGAFLVYQYTAACRDFMAPHFARIDAGVEYINIPPCKLFWGWKD